MQEPLDNLLSIIVVACVLLIVPGIISTIVIADRISKPLTEFCGKMDALTPDTPEEITVNTKIDEINRLCHDFNALSFRINELMINMSHKEREINSAKFDFLMAQINPHFIYNTLFSIKCTMSMNSTGVASNMIDTFIKLLRYAMNSDDNFVMLADEISYIEKYIFLQNFRYNNKILFTVDCPNDLFNLTMLKFLLQPIVENAIIHGLSKSGDEQTWEIYLSVHRQEDEIKISIANSGCGVNRDEFYACLSGEKPQDEESAHLGIRNINNRINLNYGPEYGIELGEKQGFATCICIRLPYID